MLYIIRNNHIGTINRKLFCNNRITKKNGIRQFRIENKAKEGESKIVGLRINKRIGFPKSQKGIDIQVLMEYLKEEIKDVNQSFIEKLENSKNSEFNFNDGNINPSLLKKILIEIAEHYPDKYNKFLENKDGNNDLKDKEGLMKEILSNNNKDRDFIIDNISSFIMTSGGLSGNVSTILTGRPSKFVQFKDKTDDELNKILVNLYKNCINELNFFTISTETHCFAIKDVIEINGEIFYLIQNPWGSDESNEFNIDFKESDEILNKCKNHKYSSFNNSDYPKTGLVLLNIKDIRKNFADISSLDFEAGKLIYTEKIKKEQFEKNNSKTFDFVLDVEKEDEIKIDITNFHTDLQGVNKDSSCINTIKIYDENKICKGKIGWKELNDINNSNILKNLEKGKKYLIRVELKKPCNINIIRKDRDNKVKFLGEKGDNNFVLCKSESNITYTKDQEDKNNFIFEKDIYDTVKIARLMEKLYEEPCISEFIKISKDEIVLHGTSALSQKLLFKVVNDFKSSFKKITGIDASSGNEIIKLENDKIKIFGIDMTEKVKNKELSLTEEKIGIIDDNNNTYYIDIKDLESEKFKNIKIQKYIVPSFNLGENMFGEQELKMKQYVLKNKDDAIKKIQDIAKNNAGLFKDLMTGGVEFENPSTFKNFMKNFYTFKEHIIAFKSEKNAINDIKNVLKNLLNYGIKVNSIQEVWETILDELITGYLIGGCLPFISLHFNEKSLLYSVMNTNYKHTIEVMYNFY